MLRLFNSPLRRYQDITDDTVTYVVRVVDDCHQECFYIQAATSEIFPKISSHLDNNQLTYWTVDHPLPDITSPGGQFLFPDGKLRSGAISREELMHFVPELLINHAQIEKQNGFDEFDPEGVRNRIDFPVLQEDTQQNWLAVLYSYFCLCAARTTDVISHEQRIAPLPDDLANRSSDRSGSGSRSEWQQETIFSGDMSCSENRSQLIINNFKQKMALGHILQKQNMTVDGLLEIINACDQSAQRLDILVGNLKAFDYLMKKNLLSVDRLLKLDMKTYTTLMTAPTSRELKAMIRQFDGGESDVSPRT